jgi:hypothetical protein
MPATESTWRDTTLLHRVFAITGVVLTVSTVWMFYQDHARSWKVIQPTAVNVDLKMNAWRQEQFETTEAVLQHEQLSHAVSAAKSKPLDPALLAEFKRLMEEDAKYRKTTVDTSWIDAEEKRLAPLAAKAAELRAAADAAQKASDEKPDDNPLFVAAHQAQAEALAAEERAAAARDGFLDKLRDVVSAAKIREDKVLGERKFKSANIDKAKADLDIAIRDNLGPEELARRQAKIDELVQGESPNDSTSFNALTARYQEFSTFRLALDKLVKQMTAEAEAAQKAYADSLAGLDRLETQYRQQRETYFANPLDTPFPWFFGKKILTLPILDAFNSPRRIDNLWSDGLEQTYGSFGTVRRFDRCTTCHQSMQKSLPGAPTDPAYVGEREITLSITPPSPEEAPQPRKDPQGNPLPLTLEDWLGIRLADEGLLQFDDVTVSLVQPRSPAARAAIATDSGQEQMLGEELRRRVAQAAADPAASVAAFPTAPGLMVGDVIVGINGSKLRGGDRGPARVGAFLLLLAQQNEPITVTVRRGLPNPYTSHPRLDLFVSDSSPHPMQTFACTVCHDGQGSATDFKWASHAPNTPREAREWSEEHGWFDNHHWIFPMFPARFSESSCLKCHHDVVDLEPSEKFASAPAPKVTHGYQLIRKYGCFGCHEVNGYDGPDRRVGPDMRLEPNYFASAQALLPLLPAREAYFAKLAAEAPEEEQAKIASHQETIRNVANLAQRLAAQPELDAVRHRLAELIEIDARIAAANLQKPADQQAPTTFGPQIHAMAGWFKDQETPGTERKSGPSLRYLSEKVDRTFLYDWLHDPTNFRPSTRMPKFFGLWDHLKDSEGKMTDHLAPELEPIEIRGTLEFLMAQSQDQLDKASSAADVPQLVQLYEPLPREPGISPWTDEEKIARGKEQFQVRGCLACHTHQDFPDVSKYRAKDEIVQGPDLSGVADKFSAERNPQGPDWLYSWIKEPTRYHTRTVMPNLFLGPEVDSGADPMSPDDDKTFDPADDIAMYLLSASSKTDWQPVPEAATASQPLDAAGREALESLMLEYLNEAFYKERAKDYLVKGIPPEMEGELKGAEKDLIVDPARPLSEAEREIQQLRYIGRKTIGKYGCYGCHDIPGFEDAKPIGTGLADWGRKDPSRLAFEHITHYVDGHGGHGGAALHGPIDDPNHTGPGETASETPEKEMVGQEDTTVQETKDYFLEQLHSGNRIGFIYQKLKEPRSYDFEKTENKRYNERLRMPQFPFSLEEREAVITFVLGLVADPPREKYVFTPDARGEALIQGRKVLEKYNCGGCHILGLEKWKISYPPETYGPQNPQPIFPFMQVHTNPLQLSEQAEPDYRNLLHSHLSGLPKVAKNDGLPDVTDLDGLSLDGESEYPVDEIGLAIDLWKPTIIDGHEYLTGQTAVSTPVTRLQSREPAWGGVLTKYLLPEVTKIERRVNPNASGSEAYGWLPPPLIGEGDKVQASWLHDFLLEPYPIRPAAFLRMPKFNMTSDEATKLVNYFAAVDNADFPFQLSPQRLSSELAAQAKAYGRSLDEAGVAAPEGTWAEQPTEALVARRFEDALKIVVDGNYCVKCHLVSDFEPTGSNRGKAPNLADVYRRLRPDYTRRWIAQPNAILPYTSMPVNIKYDPAAPHLGGVSQDLYHGTSIEQVDGLVDLLMNFDAFSRESRRIADLVKPATAPAEGAAPADGTAPTAEAADGTATPAAAEPAAAGAPEPGVR